MTKHTMGLGIALVLGAATAAAGQTGLPTTQPNLLQITREEIKVGHAVDHEKTEAGWPAAFEKAKSPYYYIALASTTGLQATPAGSTTCSLAAGTARRISTGVLARMQDSTVDGSVHPSARANVSPTAIASSRVTSRTVGYALWIAARLNRPALPGETRCSPTL